MTQLDRLIFCLTQRFPAEITAALLALADGNLSLNDAHDEWVSYECDTIPSHWTDRFAEAVAAVTGDNEPILCERCAGWVERDDASTIHNGDVICDECISQHYTTCHGCEEYHPDGDVWHVEGDRYCESCRDNCCTYCETCEEYFRYNDHDHEDSCTCEAPRLHFRFPANGHGTVANDERLPVILPAGTVDEIGIQAIRRLLTDLLNHHYGAVERVLTAVGPQWLGDKGNYTRRLSRELHNNHGVKVPAGVLTQVGNLAKQHSSDTSDWPVEFTRNLNMSAEAFCHEDSCWWQSYYESRCTLKNWGGIAMRVIDEYDDPTGRAWVQPLGADFTPTHDALNATAYIVYNTYGVLDGAKAARIVAHLTSKTYRKIQFTADQQYVNGNSGWLIADEATAQGAGEGIHLSGGSHDTFDSHSVPNTNQEIAA